MFLVKLKVKVSSWFHGNDKSQNECFIAKSVHILEVHILCWTIATDCIFQLLLYDAHSNLAEGLFKATRMTIKAINDALQKQKCENEEKHTSKFV